MSYETISIELKLDVIPPDKILVPGCEPPSDITSRSLLQRWCCRNVMVNLEDALDAIPGSWVQLGHNWGQPKGWRKKWFVLPAIPQTCCTPYPDYYAILRCIPSPEPQEESLFEYCDVLGQGFCPSPDFQTTLPPEPDPYNTEGANPYKVGVTLGPTPPPWQALPPECNRSGYYNSTSPPPAPSLCPPLSPPCPPVCPPEPCPRQPGEPLPCPPSPY